MRHLKPPSTSSKLHRVQSTSEYMPLRKKVSHATIKVDEMESCLRGGAKLYRQCQQKSGFEMERPYHATELDSRLWREVSGPADCKENTDLCDWKSQQHAVSRTVDIIGTQTEFGKSFSLKLTQQRRAVKLEIKRLTKQVQRLRTYVRKL